MAGCAANAPKKTDTAEPDRQGKVSGAVIDASAPDRYAGSAGIHYQQPMASPENALPVYPAALLSQRLASVSIKVRLIVDKNGAVAQTELLENISDAARPFLTAVDTAVSGWQFIPLIKIAETPGQSTVDVGDASLLFDGQATALPFHQDYAFTFNQTNGKPVVDAAATGAPH